MTSTLLTRVKSKLFIRTNKKALSILEGEYRSLSFGRSTDFEDLREYEPGDEIKDIDWNATARTGTTLVRRYITSKRHTVLLIADTGRNMTAITPSGESKNSVATLALGIIGYLAIKHSDNVAAIYGDAEVVEQIKERSTEANLERILQSIHHATKAGNVNSDIMRQLAFAATNYKRKHIIVVVADDFTPSVENLEILRMLSKKHDVLWLSIADANPLDYSQTDNYDVFDGYQLPEFVSRDKELLQRFAESEEQRKNEMKYALDGLGISHTELTDSGNVIPELIGLLGRRKHGSR